MMLSFEVEVNNILNIQKLIPDYMTQIQYCHDMNDILRKDKMYPFVKSNSGSYFNKHLRLC